MTTPAATPSKHALVFGASGVSGWAVVDQLLKGYPDNGRWGKVTALTNRPLSLDVSQWPTSQSLQIVSGINILDGSTEELINAMRERIVDVDCVTHVFYYAYKANTDFQQEKKDAVDMLARSITAIDRLSRQLQFVAFQTGAKMYGFLEQEGHYFPVPLSEALPRLKPPYSDQLFYHAQLDWLGDYSRGKGWSWSETRPDIVVGFAPNHSAYSLAASLGIYLSLWRAVDGEGSLVPFPGNGKSWKAKFNEGGSDMMAKQTIFLSLHPEICGKGGAFNIASSLEWEAWETKWPKLCEYFGLKGGPPTVGKKEVRGYINENIGIWHQIEEQHNLRTDIASSTTTMPGFEILHLDLADFDRQYDLSKIYNAGFAEKYDTMQIWGTTWDRMREARMIP
ncbi:hypothetical protein GE09DRAFT_961497 [Coniochaeta sp. 2T2.1]|nr:hypothetical protein GE09DRAFT_961497 [Coniochaeta sp. 2T2.1]